MKALPRAVVAVVLLGLVGIVYWRLTAPVAVVMGWEKSALDCPHDPGTLTLSGPQSSIPEYNDCQQFIATDGDRYLDERFGVFMREGPARAFPRAIPCGAADTSETGQKHPFCDNATDSVRVGEPVAVIRSWHSARYEPLGIDPGFSCLYLLSGSNEAVMKRVEEQSQCDPSPRRASELTGKHLRVFPFQPKNKQPPPAARWAWDSTVVDVPPAEAKGPAGRAGGGPPPQGQVWLGQQYVVLACGDGWCAVGDSSFTPSEFPARNDADNVLGRPEFMNRPGADIQRLAVLENGVLKPGRAWGVAIPDRRGTSAKRPEFVGDWVRTAELVYTGSLEKYEVMLNLLKGKPAKTMTQVELCAAAPGDRCPSMTDRVRQRLNCQSDSSGTVWYARIISHKWPRPDRYRCVVRTVHTEGVVVPGTVRWRWMGKDETIWTPCGTACCLVDTGLN